MNSSNGGKPWSAPKYWRTLPMYPAGRCLLIVYSYIERLRSDVDKKWQVELPRTCFFGSKGEVTAACGKVAQKEVEQWIKEQYSSH